VDDQRRAVASFVEGGASSNSACDAACATGCMMRKMNVVPAEPAGEIRTSREGVGKESEIYTLRFTETEEKTRHEVWEVLVAEFLQQHVSAEDVVVDIGAGDGHFLKNIKAGRRIAVDLSSHVRELEQCGIEVLEVSATEFSRHIDQPVDVIFMSNFLEHLPDKQILLEVLEECKSALKPDGLLMIIQPNIRYTGVRYWDYIDHHIALTEHSLAEALEVCGYRIVKLIPRFLPYTSKSWLLRLVSGRALRRLASWYLKVPLFWRVFGEQTFVIATPNGGVR